MCQTFNNVAVGFGSVKWLTKRLRPGKERSEANRRRFQALLDEATGPGAEAKGWRDVKTPCDVESDKSCGYKEFGRDDADKFFPQFPVTHTSSTLRPARNSRRAPPLV